MIKNLNALEIKVVDLEKRVTQLETEKDILTGLNMELEERLTKLENESTEHYLDHYETGDEPEVKVGGTDGDSDE